MPLVATKRKTPAAYNHSNHLAAIMQTSIEPKDKTAYFGWPPRYWDHSVGTVFILRENLAPLDIETAEAFAAFCKDAVTLLQRTEADNEEVLEPLTRQQAFAGITAKTWEAFQAEWKKDKVASLNGVNERASGMEKDLIQSMSGVSLNEGLDDDGIYQIVAVAAVEDVGDGETA